MDNTLFIPKNSADPMSTDIMKIILSRTEGSVLVDYSMFDADDADVPIVNKMMETSVFHDERENRCFGILYGMALGDAIGARLEFDPVCYNKVFVNGMGKHPAGAFNLKPGQWTDDTSMGLCLCDSLLSNCGTVNKHDLMQRFLAWWYAGYNNGLRFDETSKKQSCGLGGTISNAFMNYLFGDSPDGISTAGDAKTSGNGSIMRLGGIPVCFWDDINAAQDNAANQSIVTHSGHEASECCRLLSYVMVKLINGSSLTDTLENIGKEFVTNEKSVYYLARGQIEDDDVDRDWQWKKENFRYSPKRAGENPGYVGSYAMDATAMALHCIWSTRSAKEAIIKAVNLCGDADSVGAVTGQLAGAAYGFTHFPPEWISVINKWDKNEIGLRAYKLYHKKWLQF